MDLLVLMASMTGFLALILLLMNLSKRVWPVLILNLYLNLMLLRIYWFLLFFFERQRGLAFDLIQFKTELVQSSSGFFKLIQGIRKVFSHQLEILLKAPDVFFQARQQGLYLQGILLNLSPF